MIVLLRRDYHFPINTMKNREYHISQCCKADIYFKGIGKGFWCQKCKREITRTIIGFNKKDIEEMQQIAKKNNPKILTKSI